MGAETTVALVRPPMQVARGNHLTLACPPIGLAYLASSLRGAGVRVTVVDAVGEAPESSRPLDDSALLAFGLDDAAIVARIPPDVDVIGVSSMFSEEWPLARATLRALRRAFPRAKLVAGGEHVSAAPKLVLDDPAARVDACVLGEGEETLVELVRAFARSESVASVAGIAFLDASGTMVRTPRRGRIRAIDELARPAWDALPLEAYLSRGLGYGVRRGRSVPIIATRGCPFQCTFCSSPQMWTTRWSARSPDAVLEEMAEAVEVHRAENFDFYDLTAIVRKDWTVEFARKLAEKRWGVTWQIPAGTRSEALDEEVVELLFRSGCRNVAYAPESGSPAVLERIKKKVRLDRMEASMAAAVRAGIQVKCNFVIGFPDETRAEMLETVGLCRRLARLGIGDVNVTPFCPYPGSEIFDQLVREGRIGALDDAYFRTLASYSDLTRSDSWSVHVSSAELQRLRWQAMAEFYGRSFLHRPSRFVDLAHALVTGEQSTRLDRALADIAERVVPRGVRRTLSRRRARD